MAGDEAISPFPQQKLRSTRLSELHLERQCPLHSERKTARLFDSVKLPPTEDIRRFRGSTLLTTLSLSKRR